MHRFVSTWRMAILVLAVASCRDSTGPTTLPEAKALWQAQNYSSYVYTGTRMCFCGGPTGPVEVMVAGGIVRSVVDPVTGVQYDGTGWPTMDALFALAETQPVRRLRFDPRLGYPTLLEICCVEDDSGVRYTVAGLHAVFSIY